MPYSYKKLRGRIVEKFGTQAEFAKKIGLSTNSLSQKMTGKVGISQADINEWSVLLCIKTNEIGEYFFT